MRKYFRCLLSPVAVVVVAGGVAIEEEKNYHVLTGMYVLLSW